MLSWPKRFAKTCGTETFRENLWHLFPHDDRLNVKMHPLTTPDEAFRLADAKEAALDQVEL
jgi:hypothetical protein